VLQPRHIVGQAAYAVPGGGYVLVFLQQPTGVPSLALLAASVLLSWSMFFPGHRSPAAGEPACRVPLPLQP
jgi:hypothetical protein